MKIQKTVEHNDLGQLVTTQLQCYYKDLEVLEYPESCVKCPIGFQDKNCGRNIPFASEDYKRRPDTCKLRKIKLDETSEVLV